MAFATVTVTIDAVDEFSSGIQLRQGPDGRCRGMVRVNAGGVFDATIALQARLPGEATWQTIKTYDADVWENIAGDFSGVEYRIGSTVHATGTIVCSIFPAR